MSRRAAALVALLVAAAGSLLALASPAQAAPQPVPMSVTISGDEIEKPLTVRDADTVFAAVMDQVSWLRGAGQASAPASADLGRKYTVVVLVGDVAKQTYDLYPLAKGGPRAFRPSDQPDRRRTTAAWFFGRLNMGETLRAAGVPLPEQSEIITGGIGGGDRVTDEAPDPGEDIDQVLSDLRRVLLLNAGVIVMITFGIAGIALLVRRRTR